MNWSVERSAQPLNMRRHMFRKGESLFPSACQIGNGRQLAFVWFGHESIIEKSGLKNVYLYF